jgi:hypothetical protein
LYKGRSPCGRPSERACTEVRRYQDGSNNPQQAAGRSEIVGWVEARNADTHHWEVMGIAEFILSLSAQLAKDFVEGLNPSYIHRKRNPGPA